GGGVAAISPLRFPPEMPIAPEKVKRKYKIRKTAAAPQPVAVKRNAKVAPKLESKELLVQMIGKLKQPFSSADIIAATGVEYKKASNILTQWKGKGWLKKVSYGAYERTDSFGGDSTPAEVEPVVESHSAPLRTQAQPAASSGNEIQGEMERAVYYAGKRAPEIFTAESLAVSTGHSADACGLTLAKLERKGFVKNCGKEDGMTTYKIAK
ncbi:MAG TPA: hypothetical protein VHX90_01230, partial [Verrucomicrobiae bacterium]|nr:hypothetical protein [Verrucomicrobiae bacterium]